MDKKKTNKSLCCRINSSSNIYQKLEKGKLFLSMTTIQTGGPAEFFISPKTLNEFKDVLCWAKNNEKTVFVIGNGSNIIVSDKGFRGLTVSLKEHFAKCSIIKNELSVQAGAMWPNLVLRMAKAGFSGLSAGIGIPATIGGAIFMNAGTPFNHVSDNLIDIKVLDKETRRIYRLKKRDLKFAEKTCKLHNEKKLIILEARFRLFKSASQEIFLEIKKNLESRKRKQPYEFPNAGCFFRRANGVLPGKLIDAAGLKGLRRGGAEVSKLHANFIVNIDGASSKDLWELKELVLKRVFENCGVKLIPEVQFIGEFEK